MVKAQDYWDWRSRRYGRECEGVLFKSLARPLNEYLHLWTWERVREGLCLSEKSGVKMLDLGCGYGRLSREVLRSFKNVSTVGVDISRNYVRLYNEDLNPRGKAIVGDIRKLPFNDESFDAAIMVLSMVCLKGRRNQSEAIVELMRVLKPGGRFVIIESNKSGYDLVTVGGLVGGVERKREKPVPAVDVSPDFVKRVIKKNSGVTWGVSGIPVWTLTLPVSAFVAVISARLGRAWMRVVWALDRKLGGRCGLSLYVSYSGYKAK